MHWTSKLLLVILSVLTYKLGYSQTEYSKSESRYALGAFGSLENSSHATSGKNFGFEFQPIQTFSIGIEQSSGEFYYEKDDGTKDLEYKSISCYFKLLGRGEKNKHNVSCTLVIGFLSFYHSSHGYLSPKNLVIGGSVFRDWKIDNIFNGVALIPEASVVRAFNLEDNGRAANAFGFHLNFIFNRKSNFNLLFTPSYNHSKDSDTMSLHFGILLNSLQ